MSEPGRLQHGLPLGKLALAALLVFVPGVLGGFVYDDIALIRDNPAAHGLGHAVQALTASFWEQAGSAHYYRPLVTLSYLLDWSIGGGAPWVFHLSNALLHAAATALAAGAAHRWTGSGPAAVAVALLFALHPSRSQSVTWISGRPDVLMTVLALLALQLSHRAAHAPEEDRRRRLFALSAVTFVAALLCKETAVVVPLLAAVDLVLSRGEPRRHLTRFAALTGAVALTYVGVRVVAFPVFPGQGLVPTPLHGLVTVFSYAERLLLPWPQTFFHRPLAAMGGELVYPAHLVGLGALLSLGFALSVARLVRRDAAAALLLVASAAALGPLLNFTRTGLAYTTADHLLYLPLLPLLAGLVRAGGNRVPAWLERRDAKLALAAVLLAGSGVVLVRTLDHADQTTLFEAELALLPENPMARMSLGEEAARAGDVERAFALSLGALEGRQRYPLLLPESVAAKTYLRLLGLQAARTPDGSPRDLELLLAEMERLLSRQRTGKPARVGQLALGRTLDEKVLEIALGSGGKEALTAEAAFVASRLGTRVTALHLLSTLGPEAARHVPSVGNLTLAHARIGDFGGARAWLSSLPPGGKEAEEERLGRARSRLEQAKALPPVEAGVLRAQAYLDLGAYLLALRALAPAHAVAPGHPVVGPLLVHLLMAARLEEEAAVSARRALGDDGARAMLDEIRKTMPPRLLELRRPAEPSAWREGGDHL